MKNGNMPASACGMKWRQQNNFTGAWDDCGRSPLYPGLTKREMFAMHAMQGLSANGAADWLTDHAPAIAVKIADALLAELEKQENNQ